MKKLSLLVITFLLSGMLVYADDSTDYTTENNIRTESYCIIEDELTGEIERIDFDSNSTVIRDIGGVVYTTRTSDMASIPQLFAGQTGTNTINGWTGSVSITYTDNGTYACLTNITGSWRKVSGSSSLSNARVNYGQALGTNSRNGSTVFGTTFSIGTGFSPGKYGYGQNHFLGANISANIGGKYGTVVSNIYF